MWPWVSPALALAPAPTLRKYSWVFVFDHQPCTENLANSATDVLSAQDVALLNLAASLTLIPASLIFLQRAGTSLEASIWKVYWFPPASAMASTHCENKEFRIMISPSHNTSENATRSQIQFQMENKTKNRAMKATRLDKLQGGDVKTNPQPSWGIDRWGIEMILYPS